MLIFILKGASCTHICIICIAYMQCSCIYRQSEYTKQSRTHRCVREDVCGGKYQLEKDDPEDGDVDENPKKFQPEDGGQERPLLIRCPHLCLHFESMSESQCFKSHCYSEGAYTQLNLSDTAFPLDLVSKYS